MIKICVFFLAIMAAETTDTDPSIIVNDPIRDECHLTSSESHFKIVKPLDKNNETLIRVSCEYQHNMKIVFPGKKVMHISIPVNIPFVCKKVPNKQVKQFFTKDNHPISIFKCPPEDKVDFVTAIIIIASIFGVVLLCTALLLCTVGLEQRSL